MDYQALSLVYDRLTGDRGGEVDRIRHMIKRFAPHAETLVEFACGSGAVLKHLKLFYDISGLDISPHMLAIAKRKLPGTPLVRGSMTSHQLFKKFDVALCIFDSINHLLTFNEWKLFFANAAQHLNSNGILCFDINTVARLDMLVGSNSISPCGKDYVAFRVTKAGKSSVTWNIDVFRHERSDQYKLLKERIGEVAFPVKQVVPALRKHFASVQLLDENGRKTTRDEGRRYLICKK